MTPAGCRQCQEGGALANSLRSWHRTGHHALSGQVRTPKATNSGISPAQYPDLDLRTPADYVDRDHNRSSWTGRPRALSTSAMAG